MSLQQLESDDGRLVVSEPAVTLSTDTLVEIAGCFQDAAVDQRRWTEVAEVLARAFGGRTGSVTMTSARPPLMVLREAHAGQQPTPKQITRFEALQDQDPRVQWILQNFGRAGATNLDIGMERVRDSQVYRELLHEMNIEYSLMLPVLVDERVACTLVVDRGREQRPFTRADVVGMQKLLPLFQRAVRTQLRLGQSKTLLSDLRDALDRLPVGVLLIDGTGRVQFASRSANRMTDGTQGLAIQQGELRAEGYGPDKRLQAAIKQALGAAQGTELQNEDTLTVKRNSGGRDFELLVAPLRAEQLDVFPRRPAALVIINDPDDTNPLPWKLVQQLYGLSPAESRLSVALAKGWTLKDYAKVTTISVETARSQLKAAMSKTGTHRQVELIRLLLTGPAAYGLLDGESPDGDGRPDDPVT